MIINDTHKFVFIHIPKCAGTSVRHFLQPYDQMDGAHTARVADHPDLGRIDYVHIPLFVLREHFPAEHAKVLGYHSYAVIRDPYARFRSSLSQHLRKYSGHEISRMKPKAVQNAVDSALRLLRDHQAPKSYLPHQYIHFQRQIDFIYDQDKRLVEHIYSTRQIDRMLEHISAATGIRLAHPGNPAEVKANETRFYRNTWIRVLVESSKPVLKAVLREERWESLKQATQHRVFTSSDRRLQAIFDSDHVRDFIADYYQDDIDLFETVHQSELISTPKDNTARMQPATNTSS